jgi:hypothetical protein
MNENTIKISLLDLAKVSSPSGTPKGKEVFQALIDIISSRPKAKVIGISLKGILSTDASFPRESVVSAAKHFRGEKGIFLEGLDLTDPTAQDIIDNWDYAAIAKEQPLVFWSENAHVLIGPKISGSGQQLVELVLTKGQITAALVAAELDTSVQNASTRLKKLVDQGYFMRSEVVADSGGIEYIYQAIK